MIVYQVAESLPSTWMKGSDASPARLLSLSGSESYLYLEEQRSFTTPETPLITTNLKDGHTGKNHSMLAVLTELCRNGNNLASGLQVSRTYPNDPGCLENPKVD